MSLYQDISPYIVTDCSAETLNTLITQYEDFSVTKVLTLVGETLIVDGHYQFHADKEALDNLIVDNFYRPQK